MNNPVKRVSIFIIWIVLFSSFAMSQVLPSYINSAINKYKFRKSDVAVYIKETGKNRIVASLNIDKEMVPASVIKVYSTYAALLELGYDYRWPTKFYYTGRLQRGILYGDIVVKGFGDPTLRTSDLRSIVAAIRSKGIRKIEGNIIIDRSYFTVPKRDSSHFDKNIYSAYNAMPDALMFNQHLSKFSIVYKNGHHRVVKSIPGESYRVSNSIRSVNGSCKGKRSWPSISISHSTSTPVLKISGTLSKRCRKRTYTYIITKPYKEFYYAFVRELKKSGIRFHGKMRVSKVPNGAKLIFTHYSAPLEKIISITAKKSNNLFARHLLLTLGAKIYGAPANLDKGRRAVVQILNRYHLLDTPRCHIDNGCGLSRISRITARSLANVLDHAYKGYGKRWMKTLSIAGTDGTIRRRFRNTSVKNRAWMKTGTLNNAKNIAGYVKNRSGKLYTVVILTNGKRARWYGAKMQNDIIKWLVGYSGNGVVGDNENILLKADRKDKQLWREIDEASTSKSFFVQVGSFSKVPDESFLNKLEKAGYTYRIVNEGNSFKILVGPYKERSKAENAVADLKKDMPGAYIVHL